MEPNQIEELLSNEWACAITSNRKALERDDLYQVLDHSSWLDLQIELEKSRDTNSAATSQLAMLGPGLMKLKPFTDVWLPKVGPNIDARPIVGFIRLIVKLLSEDRTPIPHVLPMLRKVCYKIGILNSHFQEAPEFTSDIKESCVESGIAVLSFFSDIIKFLRRDMPGTFSVGGFEWRPLEDRCSSTSGQIDELSLRVETLCKITVHPTQSEDNISTRNDSSELHQLLNQVTVSDEQAKLPCVMLPSIRTSRFFDRTDIIQRMEEHFKAIKPEHSFQSLALHGLGGVGKSTVALKYAEQKLQRGELDALFWVHSEKLVSIKQSFTNMAIRLKLPDAREGDHEENQAAVLNWLQRTHCRWLIVYDNAEDPDLIRDYWPLAGHGQAIITTRNLIFGYELADLGMEIANWDNDTGLQFLLSLLASEIGSDLQQDEVNSAQHLSEKLRGHALAISTMAGIMHRRAMSITEFIKFYDQHPSKVHGLSGSRSINTLWEISFKSLEPESFSILGVMSYVEPDSIPQLLFEPSSSASLPESLEFCSDAFRFSEAIENLLTLALIKRDKVSRSFSLHRLVQTAFKNFMTASHKQVAFHDATILISEAFPRRDFTLAQLYLKWEQCALWLQHVISLKDCFREERQSDPTFVASQVYCDLSNRCQRYLLELNSYDDLDDLATVNTLALSTLPEAEQIVPLQGSLTSHKGQVLVRLGRGAEGVTWLRKSYDIRSQDSPFNPRESAWAADNLATGIATLNDFSEAMHWYEKARDHFLEWSDTQAEGRGAWPAVLKTSMSRGLFWSGQVGAARELVCKSLEQVDSSEPYNWALAASTHFTLGTIERHDRNFELAESHFMEAQNLWVAGDQMRSDPFYGACLYRLGCTALDQGQVEAAIKHLRDSLHVTEKRKNNMVAEHMRCLFKLSEAMEQEPRGLQEADRLRMEAERLLQLRSPESGDSGKEETYDNLVCLSWR